MISNEDAKEILDNSPDDTTHYCVNPLNGVNYYLCDHDGWSIFIRDSWAPLGKACASYVKDINELIAQIETSVEWKNGDHCIYLNHTDKPATFIGMRANSSTHCLIETSSGTYMPVNLNEISKPPTPEELAAKAREGAIDKLLDLFESVACKQTYNMRGGIEAVYDSMVNGDLIAVAKG